MKTRQILLLVALFSQAFVASAQTNNPTIAVCNGKQYICAADTFVTLCVNIIVNPAYPNAGIISEFEIDWGDGSAKTIVAGGLNPPSQTHVYNVGNFFGTCQYEREYIIKLITRHSNPAVDPTNSAFFLYIRNPPQADFKINPNPVCTNKPVTLTTTPCPSQGITYQFWDLGGGLTGNGPSITDTFTLPGIKTIQHCVGNVCDTICSIRSLTVLDAAVANVVADSGVLSGTSNPYKVCFDGDSAIVRLNAAASLNVSQAYIWMIMPSTGWQWVLPPGTPNGSMSRVKFTKTGTYTVIVKVNNDCAEQSADTLTIEVVQAQLLVLNPFPDTCMSVLYSPSPFNPNAVYKINGVAQATFPVVLALSPDPYIVEATLLNECGDQVLTDFFLVQDPQEVNIISPADMTVCVDTVPIALHANLNGVWTSNPPGKISIVGADTLFTPNAAGSYKVSISRGGGLCQRKDSITIVVTEVYPLSLNTPPPGCISVEYSPDPFDPLIMYKVNGTLQSTFPITLDATNSPHTITATANNVCGDVSKSVSLEIILPVDVQIMAPNDTTVCSGTATIPLFASDTVGKWIGQQIMQTPQGTVFNPVDTGSYTLVFERGFADCRRADTITIRVEPGNGVNAGADLYTCNTLATLSLSGATPPNGNYSGFALTGTDIDINQLIPGSPYIYTYTVPTLPDACNDDTFVLTVQAPPDAGFSISRDTSCIGQIVLVTPVDTGDVNFQVNWGDGFTDTLLSHFYNSAGTFPIQFTASNVNPLTGGVLCSVSGTTSIHIIQPIDADSIGFTINPDTGCAPLLVSFTNFSKAENGRYTWDFGNDSIFKGYQPGPILFEQGTEDTTYIVRLIVETGCDSLILTDTVTVFPLPNANFGISYLEPCSGGLLEASVLSTGNPLNNDFFTSTGLQVPASLTLPTFFQFYTDSIPDTVGIWLVSSNSCGIDTAYREVVVNPTDVVSVIGLPDTTAICTGSAVTFINYATSGAPISWAVSNSNTYVGDTIQVVFADSGMYTITLYAFGCGFDSMILPINVLPLPNLDVVHDLTKCPGDPVSFQVNSNAPGVQLWFGDGDSTDQKISKNTYHTSGNYLPQAVGISAFGCVASWSGSLTILGPPEAMAVADDSLCAGTNAVFSGSSTIANSNCSWDFGDGNIGGNCQTTHIYDGPGLFTAVLTVVSPEGCHGQDTIPIYVRNSPTAAFDYTILKTCTQALVAFKSTAIGATSLDWDFGDGANSTLSTVEHPYEAGGQYKVRLIATNEGICSDTSNQFVTVFQTPVLDLEIDIQCTKPEGTNLIIFTDPDNYITVKGPNYEQDGDSHLALTGTYTIHVVSQEGCEKDTSIFLLPPNELFLQVVQDSFDLLLGDSVHLEALVNQTGVHFQWTPSVYLSNDTVPKPVTRPFRSVVYTVKATNWLGCFKTDTVWINLRIDRDTSLYIPNAFTPNDDNVNDIFYVRSSNPSIVGFETFQIFDQNDEKVFDVLDLPEGDLAVPENPVFGWDGNFRGVEAEMGTYRYVIVLRYVDDEKRTATGILDLIR